MTRIWIVGLLVLGVLWLAGCGKKDDAVPVRLQLAQADMVTFDRAYIPALALTNGADAEKAKRAMALLVPQWEQLRMRYIAAPGMNPQWKSDFDNIGRLIAQANQSLLAGRPLAQAHESLEMVRTTLKELRAGYGIAYDLDLITACHAPMENVVKTAQGTTAATLTEAELALLTEQAGYAELLWGQVSKATFDPALYRLTPEQERTLRAEIAAEQGALAELRDALKGGDKSRILGAAVAIKPHFMATYLLFGDFAALGPAR